MVAAIVLETKLREFKDHDWSSDSKWLDYYHGIVPTPSRAHLERLQRRWYKIHKDIDFDTNFCLPEEALWKKATKGELRKRTAMLMRNLERSRRVLANATMNRTYQEPLPEIFEEQVGGGLPPGGRATLTGAVFVTWLLFQVSLVLNMHTARCMTVMVSLFLGLIRKV